MSPAAHFVSGGAYEPASLVAHVASKVVGMQREAEVLAVALATGRHVLIEGPPGTGKSTLLRSLADAAGVPMRFVEGNAELTPNRLLGHHDPAMVLRDGYTPEGFVPGPLAETVRDGGLLYLEEFNRIPEESLNVLITALAEGELHVPRFGRIPASPNFRLIAAMNPFDAVGTARIGQAIYDRMCRVAVNYQDEDHEREIVTQAVGRSSDERPAHLPAAAFAADPDVAEWADVDIAVALTRATRSHADVRFGASVRGAIDMTMLAGGLRATRAYEVGSLPVGRLILVDAALAALSGRIRLDEACDRQPEEIIVELLDAIIKARFDRPGSSDGEDDSGKAERPGSSPPGAQSQGRILTGEEAQKAVQEAARRTSGRSELRHKHGEQFDQVSPDVGELDAQSVVERAGVDPDTILAMLADAANATDPVLRAKARKVAARLFVTLASMGTPTKRGIKRMVRVADAFAGDVDLDATLARSGGSLPVSADEFVTRRWAASERAICLLIDRSGSMSGHGVAMASMGAASVVVAAGERADCSVIMFAKDAIVLQEMGQRRRLEDLIGDVLSLRGRGVTDLALAFRGARRQLGRAAAPERVAVLLSDGLATEGPDPVTAFNGVDRLHVLGTSDEQESVDAGRLLAKRGRGVYRTCTTVAELPAALTMLLGAR